MEEFDFVIIGAGAAGEAAATLALRRGKQVALVDEDLFGGSCAFWACIPSKALLHKAAVYRAGGNAPWSVASAFRDWNINREGVEYPDDSSHVRRAQAAGAVTIRGRARLAGRGRVDVREIDGPGSSPNGRVRELTASHVVIAIGSHTRVPPVEGLETAGYWTNREGTSLRELPPSIVVMGGGPTGVEMAQVYARYGVSTTVVDSNERVLARDHPRNSAAVEEALRRDGATVRTGVRATRVVPGGGSDGAHRVELSDGSSVDGHRILVAVGRAFPWENVGLEAAGIDLNDGAPKPDDALRIADWLYVVGDPAGPEMHTHLSHYEGEMAVRIALGDEVTPDMRAIPRATYTDPETASVGLLLEQARDAGHDPVEVSADVATSAKGYVTESTGHVTLVADRRERVLLGAFIAGPGASEAIHEAVLAVKLRVPIHVLADTIHAFPTVARVMGGLFAELADDLATDARSG